MFNCIVVVISTDCVCRNRTNYHTIMSMVVTKAGLTVYARLITVRLSFLLRTENYKHDGFFFYVCQHFRL